MHPSPSPFWNLIVRDNSPNLILAFSSASVPAGKFASFRALSNIDATVLFLNCPSNNWYLGEIPGLGRNYREIHESLSKIIETLSISEGGCRLAYGGSMGAYGAALYGSLLGFDKIVATGIEVNLFQPRGHSIHLCPNRPTLVPDLLGIMMKSKSAYTLLAGERCCADMHALSQLHELPKVETFAIQGVYHTVPAYIHENFSLSNFLSAAMQAHSGSELVKKFNLPIANIVKEKETIDNTWKAIQSGNLLSYRLDSFFSRPDASEQVKSWVWETLAQEARSCFNLKYAAFIDSDNKQGVASWADALLRLNFGSPREHSLLLETLAYHYGKQGKEKVKKTLLHRSISKDKENASAITSLGYLLFHGGQVRRAEVFALRAVSLKPHNPVAHALLAQVRLKLGRVDEGVRAALEAVRQSNEPTLWLFRLAVKALMAARRYGDVAARILVDWSITEDDTAVLVKECLVEIKIQQSSPGQHIEREALDRLQKLLSSIHQQEYSPAACL